MSPRGGTIAGRFCHAPSLGALDSFDGVIEVDAQGAIAAVRRGDAAGPATCRVPPGAVVLPGFVDLHTHAPQYPQLGTALDAPLETWLHTHTFPLEARFADTAFAERAYAALVADLLANGTTTAVYFATIHQAATRLLVDLCLRLGQRALVGKVAMDRDCPEYYRDASVEDGLEGTRALIDYTRAHPDNRGLVRPLVTPRFVPACSDDLLRGLGAIARDTGCAVQTHCSESDWQHAHVLARFGRSDTEVLDGFSLLTPGGVLAHGTRLGASDMDRIAARGAGIAHCPLSNAYFGNAVFPLRAALAKSVRIGLGTDISGGPSASMLESCRMAVTASRMLEDGVDPDLPPSRRGRPGSRVSIIEAFHLATAGGADVLGLPVGRFAPGCRFDAILVDPAAPGGGLRVWDEDESAAAMFERIMHGATRANITAVWVDGLRRAGLADELGHQV